MKDMSIQRIILIVTGTVVLILGILAIIGLLMAVFLPTAPSPYPNTLTGASQEAAIILSSAWLAIFSIIGGLMYLMPVRMGRLFRAAAYTTPKAKVVPKAYRYGGICMLVAGILAAVAHFLFATIDVIDAILMLVVIAAGIIGIVSGLVSAR